MTLDVTKCHDGVLDVSTECACLCQHHGVAYAEWAGADASPATPFQTLIADGVTVVQAQITITETCCVIVNTALILNSTYPATDFEIERPLATIKTQQEDEIPTNVINLLHHASWEVLPAGIYDYFLVNRAGLGRYIYAAWMKIIASDCEG